MCAVFYFFGRNSNMVFPSEHIKVWGFNKSDGIWMSESHFSCLFGWTLRNKICAIQFGCYIFVNLQRLKSVLGHECAQLVLSFQIWKALLTQYHITGTVTGIQSTISELEKKASLIPFRKWRVWIAVLGPFRSIVYIILNSRGTHEPVVQATDPVSHTLYDSFV